MAGQESDLTAGGRALVVVANRLPVEKTHVGWEMSPGGLVAALRPVLEQTGGFWIGWPGVLGASEGLQAAASPGGLRMVPVALDRSEYQGYYNGFANATLWPLFHDKVSVPQFRASWWRVYSAVNKRFAERVASTAPSGAAVWIHDYHLALVPRLVRELRPDLKIGFFLHIPFPPMELFAQLPWRAEILEGMLGADSVGFQTVYDLRNFRQVATRYLDARVSGMVVHRRGHETRAEAMPIAVDSRAFEKAAASAAVSARTNEIRAELGFRSLLLGVDRLDYTKGIERRLRAFELLLDSKPELARHVAFMQVVVPSREAVAGYEDVRAGIERLAGRINGKHSTLEHVPMRYRYGSIDRDELVARYAAADVMVVTPPRDGMNLVAKEYVACRSERDGVLVLSEFAGAALELHRALLVNPYDVDAIARALEAALGMSRAEQRARMRSLRRRVFENDVHAWARHALGAIGAVA